MSPACTVIAAGTKPTLLISTATSFADADPAQSTVIATAKKSTFFIPTPFRSMDGQARGDPRACPKRLAAEVLPHLAARGVEVSVTGLCRCEVRTIRAVAAQVRCGEDRAAGRSEGHALHRDPADAGVPLEVQEMPLERRRRADL